MKRLFGVILACALLISAASAQLTMTGVGGGFGAGGGGGGFSLTAGTGAGNASTGTSLSYAVTWGSGCNAVIFQVFWYNTATTDNVSSLTGITGATQIASTKAAVSNGGQSVDMWQYNSPSGTNATVTVNYSAATTYNSYLQPWCLVSTNTTVSDVDAQAFSCDVGSPISSTGFTVPSGGGGIAMTSTTGGATMTFTNATSDGVYTGGGTQDRWGHTTSTGALTVTATPGGPDGCTLSVAAWGP